nr:MAG TPA: hypothetical protein [Caudoviricetes sp.]
MLSNFYFYCAHCCLLLISVISFDPQKYKNDRESKVIRSGNRQSGITYWVNIRSKLGANAYRPFAKD